MIEEFLICQHCVADNELRSELIERGTPVETCEICKKPGGRALSAVDFRVKRIFRALVRLNFSEWEYNHHVGGDSIHSLIWQSKTIFELGLEASEEAFEQAVMTMEDGWYPETDDEITLGGGYWDGGILSGLRDERASSVEQFITACFSENYFDVVPQVKTLIGSLRDDITSIIPAGKEYFRSRIGVKASYTRKSILAFQDPYYYATYTGTDIDRPPLTKASEGRLNRPRVSVLYLASDVETAICELRPHPSHLISTAKFRAKRDLLVANFGSPDIRNFLNDIRLEVLRTILSFSDVLNMPVQPDQKELYAVTQTFADAIRESGFDAVTFRSSLGPGINVTCFTSDAFEMVPESDCVHEVTSLSYKIIEARMLPATYKPDEFKEVKNDPLSTIMHRMARRPST
jgi:hypothetical protein